MGKWQSYACINTGASDLMFIVLGIDGLGSDLLQSELPRLPHLASLLNRSAYTMQARAEFYTNSATNWGTHFYGHGPSYTGWYRHLPSVCSGTVSVFDAVPNSTAYTSWSYLSREIPQFHLVSNVHLSLRTAVKARAHELAVGIFDNVDHAGHAGSSTAHALQSVDSRIGDILSHVQSDDHVMFISDHGLRSCRWYDFACMVHYGSRASELETPMLISGPQVPSTGPLHRRVTHQDTSYYILRILNRSVPCDWKVGELTSCNSTWPGPSRDIEVTEQTLRNAISAGIWALIGVLGILPVIWCCWRSYTPRRDGFHMV
jgi:hypothetical protein